MKRFILFLILCFVLCTDQVLADFCVSTLKERKVVTLCESGCDYSNPADIISDNNIINLCVYNEITINIMDSNEYDFNLSNDLNNVYKIIGDKNKNATVSRLSNLRVSELKNVIVVDSNIKGFNSLEIDNVEAANETSVSGVQVKITNSKFNSHFMYSNNNALSLAGSENIIVDNIEVLGESKFEGIVNINNSKFGNQVRIEGQGKIENSTINSDLPYALGIFGPSLICTLYSPPNIVMNTSNNYSNLSDEVSNEKNFVVNNIKTTGNYQYGIYYEVLNDMLSKLEIKNSDLSSSGCSFKTEVTGPSTCSDPLPDSLSNKNYSEQYFDKTNRFNNSVKYMNNKLNDSNVLIENSKLTCVCAFSNDNSDIKPLVYVPSNNTWTSTVIRNTSNIKNGNPNVIEEKGAKIVIEFENNDEITLDDNNLKKISSYFKELDGVSDDVIKWTVLDESILKIEGGQIKPLKIGETDIIASYNNDEYTLHISIKSLGIMEEIANHVINPNTEDQIVLIVILFVLSMIVIIVNKIKNRKRVFVG